MKGNLGEKMKFVNFRYQKQDCFGILTDKGIISFTTINHLVGYPQSLEEVMVKKDLDLNDMVKNATDFIDENEIEYLPAVRNPEKIICVGFNYIDHSQEASVKIPAEPIIFSKFNNALAGNKEEIKIKGLPKVDYEAELVAVIGQNCKNVSIENSLDYVFGYCCGNDISERYMQFLTGQWLIGKSIDHFAPVGPYVVTRDEIDPDNLDITCKVNGIICQKGNTGDMIFNVATIVSYLSRFITLKPGDIIFTGTPAGVILGKKPEEQKWLKKGDIVEVTISGLGTLTNRFNE
jgi:2-keto-4-pentenoate hydratase/2-oxohepta-3-ene-1,7-dioic acid hydratase in catechol pathway